MTEVTGLIWVPLKVLYFLHLSQQEHLLTIRPSITIVFVHQKYAMQADEQITIAPKMIAMTIEIQPPGEDPLRCGNS